MSKEMGPKYVDNQQAFAAALSDHERLIIYIMSNLQVLFGIDYDAAKVFCLDFIYRRPVPSFLKDVVQSVIQHAEIEDIGLRERRAELMNQALLNHGFFANQPNSLSKEEAIKQMVQMLEKVTAEVDTRSTMTATKR